MVQGYNSGSWGFPKGKIGKAEDPLDCAIRETIEETGYNCTCLLDENRDNVEYIQWNNPESQIRLYIIPAVPEDTNFVPQTRREIRRVAWQSLGEIGTKDTNKYYNVSFIVRRLKVWIKKRKQVQTPPYISTSKSKLDLQIETLVPKPTSTTVTSSKPNVFRSTPTQIDATTFSQPSQIRSILVRDQQSTLIRSPMQPIKFDAELIIQAFDQAWNKNINKARS